MTNDAIYSTRSTSSVIPTYSENIYTDEALLNPYEHYRALRDTGPIVWLEHQEVFAFPRYADVRAALADPDTFCSGHGVSLNESTNEQAAEKSVLMSDGDQHDKLRKPLANNLAPRALRSVRETVQSTAHHLVSTLVDRGSFDAVRDLARVLPTTLVPNLIGWPQEGREHLLDWASATFEALGPMNERTRSAASRFEEMMEFTGQIVATGNILPNSAASELLNAAQRGEIPIENCPVSLVDYLAPSLDTTISAISSAVYLFGRHPDQWELVRSNPSLIPSAFNEVVRLESPVTGFTRVTTKPTTVDGMSVPQNARVLVMFASANRDERKWDHADEFDVQRNPSDMVGFGYGTHGCAGQGLARLEGHAILSALAERVVQFDVGEPEWALNNTIQALGSLPVSIVPA